MQILCFGFTRQEKIEDFDFIFKWFFYYNEFSHCKIIVCDECYALISVLKNNYP